MSDTLNKKEMKRLNQLGESIRISLDLRLTDLNGIGIPSRTNRFQAVEDMKEYLSIHGYEIFDEDGKVYIK
jgi:hypothetical protein